MTIAGILTRQSCSRDVVEVIVVTIGGRQLDRHGYGVLKVDVVQVLEILE